MMGSERQKEELSRGGSFSISFATTRNLGGLGLGDLESCLNYKVKANTANLNAVLALRYHVAEASPAYAR